MWLFKRRVRGDSNEGVAPRRTVRGGIAEGEFEDRREFLRTGLGAGGAAVLGVGAAALTGTPLLTKAVQAVSGGGGGGGSNSVINNPSSSTQGQNKIQGTDLNTFPLRIKKYSSSTLDLFRVLNSDTGETGMFWVDAAGDASLYNILVNHSYSGLTYLRVFLHERIPDSTLNEAPGSLEVITEWKDSAGTINQGKGPVRAWNYMAENGYVAFRSKDWNGFREIHFRDGNFRINDAVAGAGAGRLAWLIYDKAEPQFHHWREHFYGIDSASNALPSEWWIAGAGGSIAALNLEGGVGRWQTPTTSDSTTRLQGRANAIAPNKELHCEFYKDGMNDGITNVAGYLGLTTADFAPITSLPSTGIGFYFNDAETPNWQVLVRRGGTNVIPPDPGLSGKNTLAAVTGGSPARQQLRFEFWPANMGGFTSNTLKVYIKPDSDPDPNHTRLVLTIGSDPVWTTLMRPYLGVQNRAVSAVRSIDVDAFKAFWLETWKDLQPTP